MPKVEYLFPYDYPKEQLAEKLREHKLTQILHNLPAGDWAKGERGIACIPGRQGEFQDGVGRAIEYAQALGCRQLNCLAGIAPKDAPADKVRETFVGNLRFAAAKLEQAQIRLLTEPCNTRDIPGFYLNRSQPRAHRAHAACRQPRTQRAGDRRDQLSVPLPLH